MRGRKREDNLVGVRWDRKSREDRGHFVSFYHPNRERGGVQALPDSRFPQAAKLATHQHTFTCTSTHPMAVSPADSAPKQEPAPHSQAPPGPAFERWRRKAAWVAGYGLSPADEAHRAALPGAR